MIAVIGTGYWGSKIVSILENKNLEVEKIDINDDIYKIKSNKIFGVTWFPKILYQILLLSRFGSSAGAHPKNVANESPRYKDINVRSAVKTIFGLGIC